MRHQEILYLFHKKNIYCFVVPVLYTETGKITFLLELELIRQKEDGTFEKIDAREAPQVYYEAYDEAVTGCVNLVLKLGWITKEELDDLWSTRRESRKKEKYLKTNKKGTHPDGFHSLFPR